MVDQGSTMDKARQVSDTVSEALRDFTIDTATVIHTRMKVDGETVLMFKMARTPK